MAKVKFVDTTLRDGHQCLWATRMSTAMMRPIMEPMDRIGFEAIEIMGAVHFDACVRYLKDDPWERIRLFRERVRGPLQVITRSRCALGFELQPLDLHRLWVERLLACGVDRLVAFDGLHDLDNLADGLLHAKSLGAYTIGWLIFSESPIHTDALYAAKAREFIERAGVDTVMIEDTSGILTPERARTLIPAIKGAIGERPLALHTHNLVGLAQRTCIEAVDLGVESLYTCIAPIADGNAPPAVQTTIRNLRHLGHEIDLDDAAIAEVGDWLAHVAERGGFPAGAPNDFDAANFGHQIPGGVLSNLASQLRSAGLGHRLAEVLAECSRVREELGWPIMVTPFSQLVGVQATLNVLEAERYARVPDEVKRYALGYYGTLPAPVEPGVLDRIVENGSPTIALAPPEREPVVDALRRQYPNASDDERLLRHSFPAHVLDDRTPEPPRAAGAFAGIGHLVEAFGASEHIGDVSIRRGGFRLDLHR